MFPVDDYSQIFAATSTRARELSTFEDDRRAVSTFYHTGGTPAPSTRLAIDAPSTTPAP